MKILLFMTTLFLGFSGVQLTTFAMEQTQDSVIIQDKINKIAEKIDKFFKNNLPYDQNTFEQAATLFSSYSEIRHLLPYYKREIDISQLETTVQYWAIKIFNNIKYFSEKNKNPYMIFLLIKYFMPQVFNKVERIKTTTNNFKSNPIILKELISFLNKIDDSTFNQDHLSALYTVLALYEDLFNNISFVKSKSKYIFTRENIKYFVAIGFDIRPYIGLLSDELKEIAVSEYRKIQKMLLPLSNVEKECQDYEVARFLPAVSSSLDSIYQEIGENKKIIESTIERMSKHKNNLKEKSTSELDNALDFINDSINKVGIVESGELQFFSLEGDDIVSFFQQRAATFRK